MVVARHVVLLLWGSFSGQSPAGWGCALLPLGSASTGGSALAGTSVACTPRGASASLMAHITAAGVVWIAPSPQPLAPSGVKGEGVTTPPSR